MTSTRPMPGPLMTDAARRHVTAELDAAIAGGLLTPGLRVLGGGMETIRSPYLVLGRGDTPTLFLIERRNDDGEWDALLYDAPASLDPRDGPAVLSELGRIGPTAQDLTMGALVDRGVVQPDVQEQDLGGMELSEVLWDTLYVFRDLISPNALD